MWFPKSMSWWMKQNGAQPKLRTARRKKRSSNLVERLEDRTVLTTTLFLDFGFGVGMGNTLSTTTTAYRNIFGVGDATFGGSYGTGSDLTGDLNATASLDFTPLAYDFDGDGDTDNQDITALTSAVVPLIQRALEPFDINVVVVAATSFADAVATVGLNAGDPTGQFDAYNFIMDIRSDFFGNTSVGDGVPLTTDGDRADGAGLFGIAALDDLAKQTNGGPNTNTQDEATLIFSDTILDSTSGTPGTPAFNQNFAARVAYTVTHEAFHTLTAVHTTGLVASGDVIRLGSVTREDPFMVTRFDLSHEVGVAENNNYLMIAQDADIGLRDDNNNGVPDLGYVTGTGAHDVITLSNLGGGLVGVTVAAYSDSAHTALIGTETYQIALGGDTDGVILIDGGINNDIIRIDGTIPATIRVRAGEGTDGVGVENDRLIVTGGGHDGSYQPIGADGGLISVTNGATINASEIEPVEFSNFNHFTFITPNAVDNLTINSGLALGGQNALVVTGTSGGLLFEVPTFFDVTNLEIDAATNDGAGASDLITYNGGTSPQGILSVTISSGGGNDTLTIDSTNGLINLANGIHYYGGDGFDALHLTQTGGPIQTSDTYSVGPNAGDGTSTIVGPGGTQRVFFQGLEPVVDTVAAAILTVNGTAADNAINYTQGSVAANGLVTIDNFESIEFSNKTALTINAGAGSDTINLHRNSSTNPTGLTGGITVSGGDPTASDTLTLNGISGVLDNLRYLPTDFGAGTVVNDNAPQPQVTFSGIEHLQLVVQQADGDAVRVDGTTGNDNLEYTSGATAGSGTFSGTMDTNNATGVGPFAMTPVTYFNANPLANDTDVNFFNPGGADSLVFNGTAADDTIQVAFGEAGGTEIRNTINGEIVVRIEAFNITSAIVRGGDGDDTFNHSGNITVPVSYEGGDPSASDVLNFTGSGAGDVTVNLGAATVQQTGSAAVTYSGVEIINANAGAANATFTPTAGVDNVEVTPTGADALTVQANGVGPVVNFSNVGTTFNLTGGGNNNNSLIFNGTAAADTFTLTRSGPGTNPQLQLGATQSVLLSDNAYRSAIIRGFGNPDTFNISDTNAIGNIDFIIEGGNSIGDVLNYTTAFGQTYRPDTTGGSGAFDANSGVPADTLFSGISTANFTYFAGSAQAFTVEAGAGANQITATGTGAAAVRVTVDNNTTVNVNNLSGLNLNGGAGDDVISVTPGTFVGAAGINVDGGDPTASDTVIVNGTVGADAVTITPLTANSATVTGLGAAVNVAGTEHLTYNGQGGADNMNLVTPVGNTIVYFTPGADANEGGVNLRQAFGGDLLGFNYVSVDGFNGVLNLTSAADSVNVNGTGDNDLFTVTAAGVVRIATPGTLGTPFKSVTINTAGAARLDLLGGNGDDTFNVPGNHAYAVGLFVQGGDPSASDILNVDGDNVAAALTVSLTASSVTQAGSTAVTYSGIETLNITGGANAITVNGVAGQDTISVTPTGANSARLEVVGSNTVINTTNTAALTLNPGAGVDVIAVHGSGDDDVIDVNRGATTTVQVTTQNPFAVALKTISINSAFTQTLVVEAGLGDDVINVTGTGGPGTLIVHGDEPSASDTLNIDTGTDATVSFGADPTSGVVTATSGNVSFTGIEALGLTGDAAGTLTINGTNGNDAINQNENTVTVNAGTTVDFTDYATLDINGNNGDDTFNVHPTTLAGVVDLNLNGGDPTASDTVIVNGTTGDDTIVYSPSSLDSGTVTVNGVATNFSGTEHLTINGLSDFTGDSLTVDTANIGGTQVLTPGSTFDSGSVDFLTGGFATNQAVPLKFVNLGVDGSLTFDDFAGTRFDNLIYNGTAGDDTFSVDAAGVVLLNGQIPVNTPSIITLTLRGLDGDDTFNVAGDHNLESIVVEGGNPSASDVLNFTGAGGTIAVNLGGATITEAGFGPVGYTGIEIANVDAAGGDLDLTGTSGADVLSITPTDTDSATATLLSSNPNIGSTPVINGSAIGTLNVDLAGGADRLVVSATQAGETITADGALVTVGTFETVNYTNTEDLHLVGQAGSDTFNVTPALNTTIFVDGGDPIGSTPGDLLNLFPPAAFVLEAGPETDEGGLRGLLMQRVSWDHIEGVTLAGPGPAKIVGTNGDDDITVVARDASTHAGADGVQDFTVSINGGLPVLFLNQATLLIDALAGDDDIVVRAPAPNNAVWNVQLTVAGGTPAAETGDQGDVLEYETPGQQTMTYTPGAIPGTGVINDTTLASSITIAQFLCPVDNLPSSQGSIELLILDGEGGNDNVTVIGTGGADTITQTDGSVVDAGSVGVNNLLALTYEDLGVGATLAIDGAGGSDTLVVGGTPDADVFGVLANGNVTQAGHLTITRTNYENVTLRGQDGDDVFNIDGGSTLASIQVEGGDPSASDVLNYTATAGAATTVDLAAATISQTGPSGPTVGYNGIEDVNLTSSGGGSTLTVNGTAGDDTINVTPTGAGVGSFDRLGLGGSPQFTYTGVAGAFTVNGGAGGFDTLGILGSDSADTVTSTATTVTVKGGTVTLGAGLDYLNISTFGGNDNITLTGLSIGKTIDAGAGNDNVNLSAAVDAVILGGDGDDTLIGSPASDTIYGGSGNDILIGGGGIDEEYGEAGNDQFGDLSLGGNGVADDAGADFLSGGDGIDTFIWEPGDGNDIVSGGDDGGDILRFFGNANVNAITVSASTTTPSHANVALAPAVNLDVTGVENIFVNAGAGADSVTVGDLSTTEISAVNIDLVAGDSDSVTVNGRTTADNLVVSLAAGVVSVQGLGYDVNISNAAAPGDTLTVNGNSGNDTIKANAGVEATITLILNGNDGDDYLSADATLNGGAGDDTLEGGSGADTINGNDGNDTIIFNAGTGVDAVDGGAGFDVFLITADGLNNTISVSETAVTVDAGTENLIVSNLEQFRVNGLGGNDNITVTLATVAGLIDAGAGDDTVTGTTSAAVLTIQGGDGNDSLFGGGANDLLYGGSGNDTLIGGGGADNEYGEDGNDRFGDTSLIGNGVADDPGADFLFGGDGIDQFIWEPGDGSDVDQGGDDGADILRFLGSAAAEAFLLSANAGAPTHFNATLGLATVDTHGVEQVILGAGGGADSVTINDLNATEIEAVNIDLGAGDADAVIINGRNTADNIQVSSAGATLVDFQGLGYDVNITSATTADTLTVNGNNGDDSIKANNGVENTIAIVFNGNDGNDFLSADATLNGGNGDDTLVGGVGADILNGDAGNDTLTGNGGADTINGGTGSDTVLETRDANFTLTNVALTIGAEGTDTLSSIERANLSGGLGDNTFDIGAFTGKTTLFGDDGSDTVDFSAATAAINIDMDVVDEDQVINVAGRTLVFADIMENLVSTDFNDTIKINIAPFNRFVDGGVEVIIPPGDRLYVDMLGSNPTAIKNPNGKLGSFDGTVNGAGVLGTITYVDIETLAIQNPNGGGGPNGGIPIDFGAATDYQVGNGPRGVVAADVNGDGILDMIVANRNSDSVSVRFGNGFGGFGAEAVYSSGTTKKDSKRSITVALGDVDNDGDLDIAVTNRKANTVGVLLNNGTGHFSTQTYSTGDKKLGKFPMSVKMGDMNNDGNLDLVTTNASRGKKSSSIAILLGNGAGSFGTANTTLVEGRKARDLVLGDFNGDGDLDVVATNLLSREIVFMAGNGAGGLAAPVAYTVGLQPTSIIAADFNGDGILDLAVTCQVVREISVLLGTGLPVGTFGETVGIKYPNLELEISINSADLNGDGNADLIIANRVTNTLSYMLGLGNGTFDTRVDFKVGGVKGREPVAIAYGDFNNDGAIDLMVANAGTDDVSVLLRNPIV